MIRLQPPEPFNFHNSDKWPRWKSRFQQFRDASGLSTESSSKQVSTFLYCLGEEAESVLASTGVTGMKDEMIRDRLVVGIRDCSLSVKLQLDPSLTLETAKKSIRQR